MKLRTVTMIILGSSILLIAVGYDDPQWLIKAAAIMVLCNVLAYAITKWRDKKESAPNVSKQD